MVDFDFYSGCYMGSRIPQKAFPEAVSRAQDALDRFKGIYRVEVSGPEAEKMALCAMAETIYGARQFRGGVSAATVGSVSVRYEDSGKSSRALWRELYEQASIYLDIYRGTGQ